MHCVVNHIKKEYILLKYTDRDSMNREIHQRKNHRKNRDMKSYYVQYVPFTEPNTFCSNIVKEGQDLPLMEVTFDNSKKIMEIMHHEFNTLCILEVEENNWFEHISNLTINNFLNCITQFEIKYNNGDSLKHSKAMLEEFNFSFLKDILDKEYLLDSLIEMHYGALMNGRLYTHLMGSFKFPFF